MLEALHGGAFEEPAGDDATNLASPPDTASAALAQAVGHARAGDNQAFGLLFQHYNAQICSYLARQVGNDEIGRDLAQETFLRAWQNLPAIRSDAHFKPWLFRIATNAAKSHLRRARRLRWLPWLENEAAEATLTHARLQVEGLEEQTVAKLDEAERVQKALARLAPQCRTCLLLQLVAGFSQREVAETLGISEKSVSAYVSRGREQFRRAYRRLKGATG
jgi:RNA polymerase sigma-70 factor, ECF subfamily